MSLKVLIADPDWRFTQQASAYLEYRAHLVVCECGLKQVKAQAVYWRPDLVILAAELADKGVIEALHAIKPRPAVLLTSSMARFDLAWKCWQKGGDELLMKPVFRIEELHQAIVTAMENAVTGVRRRKVAATA